MAKKIYLSPSSQVENVYATGKTNEQAQCRKISKACADYLVKMGFEVKDGNYGSMYERVTDSNKWGADLHIPIHTNATANHNVTGGTQVYLCELSGVHKKVGQAIFNKLAPLTPGKSAEKLIKNNSFYEIISANAPTIYIEVEFHDTKTGADFIVKNTKAIGEAIAKGICDYYGVKAPAVTTNTYIVKKGDSLWKIAQKHLGDGARYAEIKSLNNLKSDTLKVGQILKLPNVEKIPSIKVGDTVKLNKGAKTYTGGNLASFVYGRKHKVKELIGNRAVITYLGITVAAVNVKDLTLA
jgi:N-acetylmuramoyl-L-alanine amidase